MIIDIFVNWAGLDNKTAVECLKKSISEIEKIIGEEKLSQAAPYLKSFSPKNRV